MMDKHELDEFQVVSMQREIDYDLWEYFLDDVSGVGIVVNHFRDEGDPQVNVYVVPKDKVADGRWHDDMKELGLKEPRIRLIAEIDRRE